MLSVLTATHTHTPQKNTRQLLEVHHRYMHMTELIKEYILNGSKLLYINCR